jgi:hypothetical protein
MDTDKHGFGNLHFFTRQKKCSFLMQRLGIRVHPCPSVVESGFLRIKEVKAVAALNRKELFIQPIRHANRWLKKDNI